MRHSHAANDCSGEARLEVLSAVHRAGCITALGSAFAREFGGDGSRLWGAIVDMDPTRNKRHLEWLCRRITTGRLLAQDFDKAAGVLNNFVRAAPLLKAAGVSRDINHYSGLAAIATALERLRPGPVYAVSGLPPPERADGHMASLMPASAPPEHGPEAPSGDCCFEADDRAAAKPVSVRALRIA